MQYFHRRALRNAMERTAVLEVTEQSLGRPRNEPHPVCKMEFGPAEEAARLTLEGRDYRFCSDDCLRRFVTAPERYVSVAPA